MEYTVIVEKDEKTGFYTGQCQQLPEAISQGTTLDELLKNMKEAIELVLEEQKQSIVLRYKGRKIFRRKIAIL